MAIPPPMCLIDISTLRARVITAKDIPAIGGKMNEEYIKKKKGLSHWLPSVVVLVTDNMTI